MTNPTHGRAFDGILRRIGQDAVLRGEVVDPPRRVHLSFDAELQGEQGTVVIAAVVARMSAAGQPRRGNTLATGGKNYVVDSSPLKDNGVSVQVILREV